MHIFCEMLSYIFQLNGTYLAAVNGTRAHTMPTFDAQLKSVLKMQGYKEEDVTFKIPRYRIHEHRKIMDYYEDNGMISSILVLLFLVSRFYLRCASRNQGLCLLLG
jgi:hypothetical protein